MNCAFCFHAPPFIARPATFVIDGTSVCDDHVDDVTGSGFGPDLLRVQQEQS